MDVKNKKMTKKTRTLNELRQVKSVDSNSIMGKKLKTELGVEEVFLNISDIELLVKKHPNDRDLGAKIREHYLHLTKKI